MNNRLLNFAEQWIAHYIDSTGPVNYKSFDFLSIKKSLIEYLRLYHPEYFNNLIETDELLPLIEMFAYVGELYSYRTDMNTAERVLATTSRLSSAIPLANMIGYTTTRRVCATGLVQITSLQTSEALFDAFGVSLARKTVYWNDSTNSNWQNQFELILNRILNSQLGIAASSDKTSIGGVLVERYTTNTISTTKGVSSYSINVNSDTLPMELVSAELVNSTIVEEHPTGDRSTTILFMNDGFGNSSSNTGYFILSKQGVLTSYECSFDGKTPNQTYTVPITGINNSDVYLFAVDSSGSIVTEWEHVPNIAYNDATHRNLFQIDTLEDDGVRLVFGDNNYSNIPKGDFQCWVRTSESINYSIPIAVVQNQQLSLKYYDSLNNIQEMILEFSLTNSIDNAVPSESLDQIKQAAPGVFYTQDRMVNGQDHEKFLQQGSTIIKTKAVNRTFVGHSKYTGWYDGSEVYENVKIFGEDGVLYFKNDLRLATVLNPNNTLSTSELVDQYIEPILDYPDIWLFISQRVGSAPSVRKYFTVSEKQIIDAKLKLLVQGAVVGLSWDATTNQWQVVAYSDGSATTRDIEIRLQSNPTGWVIRTNTTKVLLQSESTKFWDYRVSSTIDYDTQQPTSDKLTILRTNANANRTNIIGSDIPYAVVGLYVARNTLPTQATIDYSKIEIIGLDSNGDSFPDNIFTSSMFGRQYHVNVSPMSSAVEVQLPIWYIAGAATEIRRVVDRLTGLPLAYSESTNLTASNVITITNTGSTTEITVLLDDYVYFYQDPTTGLDPVLVDATTEVKQQYALGIAGYTRFVGRTSVYFFWQHFTDQYELVDPSKTNITDIYVLTSQHYANITNWLLTTTAVAVQPTAPTYFELQQQYAQYLTKGMMNNEIVLRPARFKVLFGQHARLELRAKIQLVVGGSTVSNMTIKQDVVTLIREYFTIDNCNFGETFLFSDLSRYVTSNSKNRIGSMLLVPLFPAYSFGDLYEIQAAPDELFIADVTPSDIEIVTNITSLNIRQ